MKQYNQISASFLANFQDFDDAIRAILEKLEADIEELKKLQK
ncbi:hypothetical protein LCGC14_1709480 [marine sediment metagenome]|uniref:Uncharacterized protein n=1 Tax=marine sediment metagenome TaxID=412755 RepID=A0A0F9I371_9ZZZZ